MPIYVYRAKDPAKGCGTCREPFEVVQRMADAPLKRCPDCRRAVAKQPTTFGTSAPEGPAQLRNMGMARLEKRSDGMYENVSAQPGAERVGTLESLTKSLRKGKRPILSD